MTGSEFRAMTIDPRFQRVADAFFARFTGPSHGGGSLAAYYRGELVLDVWAGWAAPDRRWTCDTVALSFSTGKGVASTVLHRLADRGLVSYDEPVAAYWPEFGVAGKDRITVRELMSHRAGLHRIRGLLDTHHELLDAHAVAAALAASPPDPRRLRGPGYHAMTYGTLVAEVASRVSGTEFTDLVRQEVAEPLGAPELWFHVPHDERYRIARVFPDISPRPASWATAGRVASRIPGLRAVAEAGMVEGFDEIVRGPEVHDAVMPGWNGTFSAPSLARMYAPLANGGRFGDVEYLTPATVEKLLQVQTRERDYVLGIRANWRLGYHPAWLRIDRQPLRSVAHYGFGGSGAFGDPETGLSLGFVTNRLGNRVTTVTDSRLTRLGGQAVRIARELSGPRAAPGPGADRAS